MKTNKVVKKSKVLFLFLQTVKQAIRADAEHTRKKAASLFADTQTKRQLNARQLMDSFNKAMQEKGQDTIDKSIESYVNALGTVDDYQDASKALLSAYKNRSLDTLTSLIDNVRFAAIGVAGGKNK